MFQTALAATSFLAEGADGPMAESTHGFMAIRRHAHANEVAELTALIAAPHGAMITGSLQTIDGGFGA